MKNKQTKKASVTLVTADSFVSRAAVARSGHIVAGGVVHTFTQLLTAIAKRPGRTLCIKTHTPTQLTKHPEPTACKTNTQTHVVIDCLGWWMRSTVTHTHRSSSGLLLSN